MYELICSDIGNEVLLIQLRKIGGPLTTKKQSAP